jgi:hypothetical protein
MIKIFFTAQGPAIRPKVLLAFAMVLYTMQKRIYWVMWTSPEGSTWVAMGKGVETEED